MLIALSPTAHKKGFSGYASRFVDPAMGFAVGYNYLFKYWVVTPNNLGSFFADILSDRRTIR